MKVVAVFLAAILASVSAVAQGLVSINNRVRPEVDAPFEIICGTNEPVRLTGLGWKVQLFGGPAESPVEGFNPLEPSSTTFRTGIAAGYVNGVTATVPNVRKGRNADILVRLLGPNGFTKDFGPFPVFDLGYAPPFGGAQVVVP